jgi:ribose transport system ATP-binding protein
LLVEPTHGVDVGAKTELYDIIREEADNGLCIVLASSEIPEIMALCDRVAVLSKGRLTAIFNRDEMNEKRILEAAFAEFGGEKSEYVS